MHISLSLSVFLFYLVISHLCTDLYKLLFSLGNKLMIMMMMIMMARTEYIHRPVKATTNIHYKICQIYRFKMRGKWYACDHSPQIVVKNEGATVIW